MYMKSKKNVKKQRRTKSRSLKRTRSTKSLYREGGGKEGKEGNKSHSIVANPKPSTTIDTNDRRKIEKGIEKKGIDGKPVFVQNGVLEKQRERDKRVEREREEREREREQRKERMGEDETNGFVRWRKMEEEKEKKERMQKRREERMEPTREDRKTLQSMMTESREKYGEDIERDRKREAQEVERQKALQEIWMKQIPALDEQLNRLIRHYYGIWKEREIEGERESLSPKERTRNSEEAIDERQAAKNAINGLHANFEDVDDFIERVCAVKYYDHSLSIDEVWKDINLYFSGSKIYNLYNALITSGRNIRSPLAHFILYSGF